MAQYDHLPLMRVGQPVDRRKQPAPMHQPQRGIQTHAKKLDKDVDALIAHFRASTPRDAVDPSLIFKLTVDGVIADDEWDKINLRLLAHTDDKAVILFADDSQLQAFRERLNAYAGDKPAGQKAQRYEAFINAIGGLAPLDPIDRIGPVLAAEGFIAPSSFLDDRTYLLDVELWRPNDDLVGVFIDRVIGAFEDAGGEELSRYTPSAGLLVRVRGPGMAVRLMLDCIEVATIDRPPQPDLEDGGVPEDDLAALGSIHAPDSDAIRIGVIDSGVNDGHPLLAGVVVDAFGVGGHPAGDDKGHGTAVAAVAAYGDLDTMRVSGSFNPRFAIVSARVVDARGKFADMDLAPQLIEEAIRTLHDEYGCRIINISLADPQKPIGPRGTLWSAILDTVARELDVILVVTTGNTSKSALMDAHGNGIVDAYPHYLMEDANRILDPGGALNALTVGALAHVNGLSADDDVAIQSLAGQDEPAPFTRTGLGLGGAIKPDLVEYGGTAVYNGTVQRLRDGADHPAAGILSLHHQYTDRIFATFSGTSFAAPLVAYKVALLLERFPDASANKLRALMALGAEQPGAALETLDGEQEAKTYAVLGYGLSDIEAALFSDDDRVVLTADSMLEPDQFAIFELPIPLEFQTEAGQREFRIALAFDPPVRRSRKDYAGIRMRFDLVRGATQEDVYEAYRALDKDEETPDKLVGRQQCGFSPGIKIREMSSLQCGTATMQQNISQYGNTYFVVVRCVGRWAADLVTAQPFSVAVMMRHSASIGLYSRLRARLRT